MNFGHVATVVLALAFVLALIAGAALIARRLGFAHATTGARQRRLAVVEVLALDARRRLVLVRRDATEHLLLVGTNAESVVVERNITGGFTHALAEQLPGVSSPAGPEETSAKGDASCAAR